MYLQNQGQLVGNEITDVKSGTRLRLTSVSHLPFHPGSLVGQQE